MSESACRTTDDARYLDMAARLAIRGHGGAEPNPMVGCVIVSATGQVVGWGYHRRCGEPHAEVHALHRAGPAARGATVYVTLEPCNHTGRTPPCTEALIEAGVGEVVIARPDPHPDAAGGRQRLKDVGIPTRISDASPRATAVADPFVHRLRTRRPWVVAKWAQTIDGRLAARTGDSQWISSDRSRRMVHRERGRVDVIMTGIGTVLADDPELTARHARVRRVARRVVVDPRLETPLDSQLVRTVPVAPLTVAVSADALRQRADHARALQEAGVEIIAIEQRAAGLDLARLLEDLVARYNATTVLVEAGPGLLSRLLEQRLVCEAWVFTAPKMLADAKAVPIARGAVRQAIGEAEPWTLLDLRRRGNDIVARYRLPAADRDRPRP